MLEIWALLQQNMQLRPSKSHVVEFQMCQSAWWPTSCWRLSTTATSRTEVKQAAAPSQHVEQVSHTHPSAITQLNGR